MFGILQSLTKAALSVVTVPAAVVTDFVTMGGHLTDKKDTYTSEALSDLVKNLKDATRP